MTLKLGIDFGTSYTAAAIVRDGRIEPIVFDDGQQQFRTAVYLPRYRATAADFHVDAGELARRVALARREQARMQREIAERQREGAASFVPPVLDDAALERREYEILRREWLRDEAEVFDVNKALEHAVFGDAAVLEFMESPDGALVESPKSMLGYRLDPRVMEHIQRIVTAILRHVRVTAQRQLGNPITEAVIGRPVKFKGSAGDASQVQAENLLRESARRAGFELIEFEYEPLAAALYHHDELSQAEATLIVDIGGGTTDVTHALLGDRAAGPRVFGNYGEPVGGTDIDFFLNLYGLMPYFGRNQCGLGAHWYSQAANVRNVVDQRSFLRADHSERAGEFAERLHRLQLDGGTTYLNHEAERVKIELSSADSALVDLSRFEPGLLAALTHQHRDRATAEVFPKIERVVGEALRHMAEKPERIFLTGGSSRSPLIQALVQSLAPEVPLTVGNPSFSVVSGLALRAAGMRALPL